MPTIQERRAAFRKLHEEGCFLIPNPWDAGSARYLQSLGFKALATTSSGSAFTFGKPDGGMTGDEVIEHVRLIVEASDLPVNADFEDGFGETEAELIDYVRRCTETGVAGLSIEDSTGNPDKPLYDFDEALARMKIARATIDATAPDVMLIGRAECFLTGHGDPLNEAIKRLQAYSEAGADCLYAPGIRTKEQITTLVQAVAPKPFNLLVGFPADFTLQDAADWGVRRVSVGGALAASAWGGFQRAAADLQKGSFAAFAQNANNRELNAFFRQDQKVRNG